MLLSRDPYVCQTVTLKRKLPSLHPTFTHYRDGTTTLLRFAILVDVIYILHQFLRNKQFIHFVSVEARWPHG